MNPKQELEKEMRELERLLNVYEQTAIDIARSKRRIAAWRELLDDSETGELVAEIDLDLGGLTDVVRTAMRASRKAWMTTAEIQQAIKELGFPLDKYKAPAASILTTVNRLVENDEVVVDKRPQPGASEYKWVGRTTTLGAILAKGNKRIAEGEPLRSLLPRRSGAAYDAMRKKKD